MAKMEQSDNIYDGVHFLNGRKNYLFRTYVGRIGDFDVNDNLVYPSNEWILNLFNEAKEYYSGDPIKECLATLENNPKDWIIAKHLVYRKKKVWLYGQISLYSPTVGLKCYKYEYLADAEPPDICDMVEFEEIPTKEFKIKSSIRQYIN